MSNPGWAGCSLSRVNGAYCTTGAQFANHQTGKLCTASVHNPSVRNTHRGTHTMTASRDLEPDTEITWDYGQNYWKSDFTTETQGIAREIIFPNLNDDHILDIP